MPECHKTILKINSVLILLFFLITYYTARRLKTDLIFHSKKKNLQVSRRSNKKNECLIIKIYARMIRLICSSFSISLQLFFGQFDRNKSQNCVTIARRGVHPNYINTSVSHEREVRPTLMAWRQSPFYGAYKRDRGMLTYA